MKKWQKEEVKPLKLEDTIDINYQKLFKDNGSELKLTNLFSPFISKMVNYANKSVISCDKEKFARRFKITPDNTILDLIEEMYSFGFNPILAGGKMISYVNCEKSEESKNDYDIFFTSFDDYNSFNIFLNTIDQRFKRKSNNPKKDFIPTDFEIKKNEFKNRFRVLCNLNHVCEFLYTSPEGVEIKLQLITKCTSCIEEILEGFDFRCCAIAYHKNKIFWVSGALKDIKNKKLVVCSPRKSSNIFSRVIKYAQKGYNIDTADLLALSILHVEFYMGLNNDCSHYQIEAVLETLIRNRLFDRNREDYANLILGEEQEVTFNEPGMRVFPPVETEVRHAFQIPQALEIEF